MAMPVMADTAGTRAGGMPVLSQLLTAEGRQSPSRSASFTHPPPASITRRARSCSVVAGSDVVASLVMERDATVSLKSSQTEIPEAEPLKPLRGAFSVAWQGMKKAQPDSREREFLDSLSSRLRRAVDAGVEVRQVSKGQIAEAIGISLSRLSNWINNTNRPDWYGVARFCRRDGISADWLLLGDEAGLRAEWAAYFERAALERQAASE